MKKTYLRAIQRKCRFARFRKITMNKQKRKRKLYIAHHVPCLGHTDSKKIIYCLSEFQIQLDLI